MAKRTAPLEPGIEKSTFPLIEAGRGTAQHRRRVDLFVGQVTKEFAETRQSFFKKSIDGFKRGVTPGNAGAAVDDQGFESRLFSQLPDQLPDFDRLIFHHVIGADAMAFLREQFSNELPAFIGFRCPGITARNDAALNGNGPSGLVFVRREADARVRAREGGDGQT